MSIYSQTERRWIFALRLVVLGICVSVLILYLLGLEFVASMALPVLGCGLLLEGYALARRVQWTMRSPREIARERRERQRREDD